MKRALTAVLLATVVAGAAGCGGAAKVVPSHPYTPVAAHQTVLAGQVQIVAYSPGDVRICPPYADTLVLTYPPQPPVCKDGVPATGVDTRKLTTHAQGSPERWGSLYVVGRYANGRFAVDSQRPFAPRTRGHDPFAKPPCPAPAGGWNFVPQALRPYLRLPRHAGIDSVAFFGKGDILTIAATNPERARAALAPAWPRELCVVKARYAPAVVTRVRHRMLRLVYLAGKPEAAAWGWPTGGGGKGVSPAGQPTTSLQVLLVTPKLRAYLRQQPPGIIVVEASLKPLARG